MASTSVTPAANFSIKEELPIGFHFCNTTHSTIKEAILTLAAPCKLWISHINWYRPDLPFKINFERPLSKTPIVDRLRRYQRKAKDFLRRRHRILPEHLDKIFYMPIMKGELLNESVSD